MLTQLIQPREQRGGERSAAAATARNFLALVSGATLGELTCMEKLVQELVATKDVNKVSAASFKVSRIV